MSRRNKTTKKSTGDSLLLFIGFLIFSIILTVSIFFDGQKEKTQITATIVRLEDWEYHSNYTSKDADSRGNFITHDYLCEFVDANGIKNTGLFTDRQRVPFNDDGYQAYIAYEKGDVLEAYYYTDEFEKTGRIYRRTNKKDYGLIGLVPFWGLTIVYFFLWLSERKEWK